MATNAERTWADDVVRDLRSAMAKAMSHPDSDPGMIRAIRRAISESVAFAKSDAPHLTYPEQVGPESVTL